MAIRLEFLTDAKEFLENAGGYLSHDPVQNTVVATIAQRFAGGEKGTTEDWWLVVHDDREVVGAGMRTAPFPPRPVFLLSMPEEAARLLARALYKREEVVYGLNGALPAVRVCAEESARLIGGVTEIVLQTRLFEIQHVVSPARPGGHLRPAAAEDCDLAVAWWAAFMADADEQAGRPPGSSPHEAPHRAVVMRRIEGGQLWLWVDEADRPVHLTAVNPVSFGAARLSPVYTPPGRRGRGYASAAVAEISQRILDQGVRPCLFTDQANPTSNRIYQALGYRPVTDMADVVIKHVP
ncbi:MAG: GNAT family N-acetyltransferase [Ornithinimicrobium sp.]